MKRMAGRKRITNAEWKFMNLLWKHGSRSITELTRELQDETKWSKQAVAMMLCRMDEKGLVRWKKNGRTRRYFPTISRDEVEEAEAKALMDKVFKGLPSLLISTVVRQEEISEEEFEELRAMLETKRK